VPARSPLPPRLIQRLRTGQAMRYPKVARQPSGRGRLRGMVPLHARPAEADDRRVPGHWDRDLVMGRRPPAVASLVERSSRYLLLVALPDGLKAKAVQPALRDALQRVPAELRRSLAWDRGRELAAHAQLTAETGCPVYFCDPKSPWQRGTNENTNRLLRQYLARSEDLRRRDQLALDEFAARLNDRPRRVLGWRTPAEVFAQAVAAAGGIDAQPT
jgi:IS30 family transposase